MSADNCLRIREDEKGEYNLSECWMEGGDIQAIGHYKTLRAAFIAAEEYQLDNEVEGGTSFHPFPRSTNEI